ncbi:MAG TPA: hypothetical protein VN259_05340 [Xanthomonadales bacterium]|nr:hypothetical protein [Xanthomonadales bacterium]
MTLSRLLLLSATLVLSLLASGARAANTAGSDNGRDLVLRYLHEVDCGTAAMAASPASQSRFEARLLKQVPPSQHDAERTARMQALARRASGCEHVKHQVRDISIMYDPNTRALLQQAADAGDRYALLSKMDTDDAAGADQTRERLYEVVRSGDPLAISEIGMQLAPSRDPAQFGSPFQSGDMAGAFTWLLVACDLGLECGPASRELDRWCLRYGGGCAQDDLAGAMRLVLGEAYIDQIDAQRRVLVGRIRNRQWEGLFAPLANTVDPAAS